MWQARQYDSSRGFADVPVRVWKNTLVASESFLRQQNNAVAPMARPVYLKWNNHEWREHHNPLSLAVETTANEEYTNQSTATRGNIALGDSDD
jgi:putative transposase